MGGIRQVYTFKCPQGHITTEIFPGGTKVDDHDEISCVECLKADVLEMAYVVFVEAETKYNGTPRKR